MLGSQHAKAAAVAIGVEHVGVFGEARHEAAVVALVVEPAGLLATGEIGHELGAILDQLDRAFAVAFDDSHFALQPFEFAHRRIVLEHDRPGRQLGFERLQQHRRQRIHAGAVDLDHQRVAEAVDDYTRQAIGLGVDQPVVGHADQLVAERNRVRDAPAEEQRVDVRFGIGGQHARRDQRMRIEGGDADRLAARRAHDDQRACRQGLGLGIH